MPIVALDNKEHKNLMSSLNQIRRLAKHRAEA